MQARLDCPILGYALIRACIERELPFTIIPGPSAILTALLGSGFSTEKFSFRGFLPVKSGQRERELRAAAESEDTVDLLRIALSAR